MQTNKKNNSILAFSIFIILISILIIILFNPFHKLNSTSFSDTLNVEEFYILTQKPNTVILDVRTPEEYNNAHLSNAILIDFHSENFETEITKLDKSKTYLIHCRTDRRSGNTLLVMKELGFKNLFILKGGILDWIIEGKPTVKEFQY